MGFFFNTLAPEFIFNLKFFKIVFGLTTQLVGS